MLWLFLLITFGSSAAVLSARRRARMARLPPLDDPRWWPQRGKQVAGRPCIDCGAKLIGEDQGMECETCGEIVHRERCLARHIATKHGPEADAPYR